MEQPAGKREKEQEEQCQSCPLSSQDWDRGPMASVVDALHRGSLWGSAGPVTEHRDALLN